MSERLTISVSEAARRLGVSKTLMYTISKRSDFPAFQLGSRIVVSEQGLAAWVEAQAKKEGNFVINPPSP